MTFIVMMAWRGDMIRLGGAARANDLYRNSVVWCASIACRPRWPPSSRHECEETDEAAHAGWSEKGHCAKTLRRCMAIDS